MELLIQFLLLVLGHLTPHPFSSQAAVSFSCVEDKRKHYGLGTMSAIIRPKPVIEAHCFPRKYSHNTTSTQLTQQMQCNVNQSIKQSIVRWGTRTKDRFESSKMATKSRTDTRCLPFVDPVPILVLSWMRLAILHYSRPLRSWCRVRLLSQHFSKVWPKNF